MKVAVIGSRSLSVPDLMDYLPQETTEIISGGAQGMDRSARDCAMENHLKLTEYLPDYRRFGKAAPLRRNITIIEQADLVLAFWDGRSPGTRFVIEQCEKRGIPLRVVSILGQG